ncbi:PAC2 family-domain-containing protein [Pilobolus umbonatus]|nr:PAC2 family-domain-containing protein [Pilobolus umbonatus]
MLTLPSFPQSTLLLPTVSIGNVPQLVTDLIIHTLHMERVGCLDSSSVVPISGPREDGEGVMVPLEVYQSKDKQWTCLQQRSPAIKGKRQQYIDTLSEFSSQFKQIIIITTMDASRRVDADINGSPFRTYEKELPESLPGSGLARHLYESITHKPTQMVMMFVLEGDNAEDSMAFVQYLNTLLHINKDNKWTPPKSWQYLFGTPFNADLYQ